MGVGSDRGYLPRTHESEDVRELLQVYANSMHISPYLPPGYISYGIDYVRIESLFERLVPENRVLSSCDRRQSPDNITGFENSVYGPSNQEVAGIIRDCIPPTLEEDVALWRFVYRDYVPPSKSGTIRGRIYYHSKTIHIYKSAIIYSNESEELVVPITELKRTLRHEIAHIWTDFVFNYNLGLYTHLLRLLIYDASRKKKGGPFKPDDYTILAPDSDMSNYDGDVVQVFIDDGLGHEYLRETVSEIWARAGDFDFVERLEREYPGHRAILSYLLGEASVDNHKSKF